MSNQVCKKFVWVIKNFSSLQCEECYSVPVLIGDCKWLLCACPKGLNVGHLSLYLDVADFESLPSGWRIYVKYRLTIINQLFPNQSSVHEESHRWFNQNDTGWGFPTMITLDKLHDEKEGFLVNGDLMIVAEVDVLEVIGTLDASEKSRETSSPLKKIKLNDDDGDGVKSNDTLKEASAVKEIMDAQGFDVLPSQVKLVESILERHPDFASKSCTTNRHLKSTYMNVLLGLIETLCQLPEELSDDDLDQASAAVSYVTNGGFKIDWLEKKLVELKAKKKIVESGNAQKQQLKEELQKCNQKCLDLKALLKKQNAEVLGANVRFSFDDVV